MFENCGSLTSITVSEDNANFKDIDGNLYTKDGKTLLQYAIGKKGTSFTIPNGVETIGSYAFEGCDSLTSVIIGDSVTSIGFGAFWGFDSLTSIVIGDSVTFIDDYAFYGCSGLNKVYYKGNSTEWGNITIGSDNSKLTSATRYYYSESQPTSSGNYWHYVDGVPTAWVYEG